MLRILLIEMKSSHLLYIGARRPITQQTDVHSGPVLWCRTAENLTPQLKHSISFQLTQFPPTPVSADITMADIRLAFRSTP